ncbi:GspE/PulE family protein [Engelhardtia mirabilis]|uniref:Type II/IV secretion system protein n=1 Tax=Engelhardtia mirabilis TaxID=2528011 RepID=A0A518BJ55_9BACT|nr:Type II/IV secretion system protein [Planctomycetes bacterium Pla133]QDV01333.1 Type II/IV secretion system protein [Planctomycetes bacterium Pla86]
MSGSAESGSGGRRLLGQILKARGVVREGQIQDALEAQRNEGGLIGQHLVAIGACKGGDVAMALAEQAGIESVDLSSVSPTDEALELIDGTTAYAYGILPLRISGGELLVALADPLNLAMLEDLSFSTGRTVRGAVGDAELLKVKIREAYGEEKSLADVIAEAARAGLGDDPESAGSSAPVVRLLNSILFRAIRDRASDVHFEVYENAFRIRYRVDGSLYEVESPPAHLAAALLSRIKVLSDLDIAETKVPQDGRISLSIDGRPVDLRVATLPGISGEGAVLRVLDRAAVNLDLAALGFDAADEAALRALTKLPNGIVLVTGPTGSGKTTTLYAMLNEANDPAVKIITVEDPVEYDIDGIVQVPINPDIGVDYAAVLRTILRQDPDKILVGEIRDGETAATAIEASLTGHTVFATVHTNDAPSAITRMLDMKVEPFLLTATLETVVAQRLVRTVCPHCRTSFTPDEEFLLELGPDADRMRGRELKFGKGCAECFHTGYLGRTALCEIMHLDHDIRAAILEGESTAAIRARARATGMRSLREVGLDAVLAGITTVEEVLRETAATF